VRRAEPDRVAAHEIPLELGKRVARNHPVAQRSAAGVEAVDDAARVGERHQLAMARLTLGTHFAERDWRARGDAADRLERQLRRRRQQDRRIAARSFDRIHALSLSRRPPRPQTTSPNPSH
jgi:hypothetical protein